MKNKAMIKYLSRSSGYSQSSDIKKIIDLFCPSFIKKDDCIFLEESIKNSTVSQSDFQDKTSFEAFINHVHINDYISFMVNNPYEILNISIKVLEAWGYKLKFMYPDINFLLILSFDGEDCTLRFHTYRQDELNWIDIENLDGYSEGILLKVV
jgi:hypothetical protein